jgi:hypothetical protein
VDWAGFEPTISAIPMLYPTERREKEVSDFPRAAAVGQALIGLQFLAEKNKILQHVQQQSQINPDCEKMIPVLEKLEDR